jgi:flagellar assembly protein FliH
MRLLSRIIKSSFYSTIENKKIIKLPYQKTMQLSEETSLEANALETRKGSLAAEAEELIDKAKEEAAYILQEAEQRAQKMMEEARQEVNAWWEMKRGEDEAVRAQVEQEGYIQGLKQGKEEGRKLVYEEYTAALQQAADILREAPILKRKMIEEAEPFIIELTIAIARKVIGEQLLLTPEHVMAMIRKALSHTQEYKLVVIAVSPDSYEYVQENRVKLLEVLDSQVEITVIPDETVTDGGVIIRTSMGSVDARVDTQLEEIKKALLETLTNESES